MSQRGDPWTTRKINVIWNLLFILSVFDKIESMQRFNLEMIKYSFVASWLNWMIQWFLRGKSVGKKFSQHIVPYRQIFIMLSNPIISKIRPIYIWLWPVQIEIKYQIAKNIRTDISIIVTIIYKALQGLKWWKASILDI